MRIAVIQGCVDAAGGVEDTHPGSRYVLVASQQRRAPVLFTAGHGTIEPASASAVSGGRAYCGLPGIAGLWLSAVLAGQVLLRKHRPPRVISLGVGSGPCEGSAISGWLTSDEPFPICELDGGRNREGLPQSIEVFGPRNPACPEQFCNRGDHLDIEQLKPLLA
jgi:hypothetical protein